MTLPIDICPRCRGRMRPVSLTKRERIELRIGKSWMVECRECQHRERVVPEAWRTFSRFSREQRRGKRASIQPTLF